MQITKAMKLISVVKLRKAKQQLEQTLPFFNKVKATMADILFHSTDTISMYFDPAKSVGSDTRGYITFTGDKGLAGGYNNNIIKVVESHMKGHPNSKLLVAGHAGRNYFMAESYDVDQDFDHPVQNPTVYRAQEMADYVLDLFRKNKLGEVYVVYTKMISSIRLEPVLMKLLPLDMDALKDELTAGHYAKDENEGLEYEPSPGAVLDVLVPKYIKGILYGAIVEAFASEQSARMTAMDSATNNAQDMIERLKLYYNRARQAAITQEISEIVEGAAALEESL